MMTALLRGLHHALFSDVPRDSGEQFDERLLCKRLFEMLLQR